MTSQRRHLMHMVMDGDMRIAPYLYFFDQFRRCDEMLGWLVKNQLTGKNFFEWAKNHHKQSMLGPAQEILRRMQRGRENESVLFGKDYVGHARPN